MANLHDNDRPIGVVDGIQDAVDTLPDAVMLFSRELL